MKVDIGGHRLKNNAKGCRYHMGLNSTTSVKRVCQKCRSRRWSNNDRESTNRITEICGMSHNLGKGQVTIGRRTITLISGIQMMEVQF